MSLLHSISVLIPNYNGKSLLEQNLPYVYEALKSSEINDFEIIIADDASTDDSVAFIKHHYPSIIVVENKINSGFGGNCNSGIKKATKDLVLLLNSDVQLTPHYFTPLLPYFKDDNCFGVMGAIWNEEQTVLQDTAKYPKVAFGKINGATNYKIDNKNSGTYSFFLSGANALVNREKLNALNGFDELFNPYYFEDLDLGIRAWKMGYTCHYDPQAICYHPLSSTIKKEPSEKVTLIIERNKIYVHYKHLPTFQWFFYSIKINAKILVQLVLGKKKRYKSYLAFKELKKKIPTVKKETTPSQVSLLAIKKRILQAVNDQPIVKF